MVNVKLATVYWLEVTVLAVVLLVDCVWVDQLCVITLPDLTAPVPTGKGRSVLVSDFNSCITTDGA